MNTYEHPRNQRHKITTPYSEQGLEFSENTEQSRQTYITDGHTDTNQRRQFDSVTAELLSSQNGTKNDNPDNATKETHASFDNCHKKTGNNVNTDTGSDKADAEEEPEVKKMGLLEGAASEISEEMRAAQDLAQYLLDKHIIKVC